MSPRAGNPGPRAPQRHPDEIAVGLQNLMRWVDLKLQSIFGKRVRFGLVIDHGDRVTTISVEQDKPVIARMIKAAADGQSADRPAPPPDSGGLVKKGI